MAAPKSTSLGTDMFDAMSTYLRDYKEAHAAGSRVELPSPDKVDHVVLSGMGGSGIGASLVEALVRDTSPKPVVVVKDYDLPRFANSRTLVIATSYSGETEETLASLAQAHERGAHVAGISSGGALSKFLEARKRPLYGVPKGRQPRAALPLLFGALGGMFQRLGLGDFRLDTQDENLLSNLHVRVQPHPAAADNLALRMAEQLRHARTAIYAEGPLGPVAIRWKCQLNENAKVFARAERLPEANHNDLVPWAHGNVDANDALVLLRRVGEPNATRARFEFLHSIAKESGATCIPVQGQCRTALGQVLEHLLLGDYVSVYLAILRGVDPTPVNVISALKARLEKDGRAKDARQRLGI